MSADTLRQAARQIREDGDMLGGFLAAVADWLDNFATHWIDGDYGPDECDAALAVANAYLGGDDD